jgi:hypothetical protein
MGPRISVAFVLLASVVAGCDACEPNRSSTTRAEQSSTGSAPAVGIAASVAAPQVEEGAKAHRVAVPCRAIAVDGDVQIDSDAGAVPLVRQDEVEPGHWLWLPPNARLVAKDPRTGRETSFRGLGHILPCVGLLEESWVTSGTFESAVGAGESPGAEEWVVTALCVVRFGAAKVTVEAPARPLHDLVRVGVADGVAFVWAAQDASIQGPDGGVTTSPIDEGWIRMSGAAATLSSVGGRSPLDSARSAIDGCRALASSAYGLAGALLGVDADGKTAVAQVTARRLARAACAVASIRVDTLANRTGKEALSASLKEADGLWRSLPAAH